tara:strand:+ start:1010 stop:1171 length:162 start_codon:yes stop_codon:yes gene_type:complete
MTKKNLYKTIYKDQYTEFTLETVEEKKASDKRLKDLKIEFTTEKVNHLKKNIN